MFIYDIIITNYHTPFIFDKNKISNERKSFKKALQTLCFKSSSDKESVIQNLIKKINSIASNTYESIVKDLYDPIEEFRQKFEIECNLW